MPAREEEAAQKDVPGDAAFQILKAAMMRDDWPGVQTWEGRIELMMVSLPSGPFLDHTLRGFARAVKMIRYERGTNDHALDVIRIQERCFAPFKFFELTTKADIGNWSVARP